MFVRCETCKGDKKIARLGMIEKKCDVCEGSGVVRIDEAISKTKIAECDVQATQDKKKKV